MLRCVEAFGAHWTSCGLSLPQSPLCSSREKKNRTTHSYHERDKHVRVRLRQTQTAGCERALNTSTYILHRLVYKQLNAVSLAISYSRFASQRFEEDSHATKQAHNQGQTCRAPRGDSPVSELIHHRRQQLCHASFV